MDVDDDTFTEQKDESNPPTAAPSVDAVDPSTDSLSMDPSTWALPPSLSDQEDVKMDDTNTETTNDPKPKASTVSEPDSNPIKPQRPQRRRNRRGRASNNDDADDYLDLDSQTLAATRSRRQRTKVSYRDDSSSEEELISDDDSEAGNPLFVGLSKEERAAMKAKMEKLQNEHSEQARKEREQSLEEIISCFEFNIAEKVTKEEAGFIHDFCTKHQLDVNDKIEDEGDFFLMSMREMMEERLMEIKNGNRIQSGSRNKGADSDSEFDANDYDDSDDSEYDVDSDYYDPDVDHENLISDEDEYGGFVVGGGRGRKRKRRKNVWVDKDGREYHCKGRLLLDDALKDTVNFEGWSQARVGAWKNKKVNPNAYYYRFNDPGEEQQNGRIREDEHKAFMQRVMEHGVNHQWGIFSKAIKGRVGYQCSNYWRQMMKDGWVKDPNYWIRSDGSFQFKRAKKGSIPDALRRYSFVVTHDPSKVFDPLPGSHPKKPSDANLAKYLQTNVKALSEREKKGKKKKTKKKDTESAEETEAKNEDKVEEESTDNKVGGHDAEEDAVGETTDNKEPTKKRSKSKRKSTKKKKAKKEGGDGDADQEEAEEDEVEKKKSKKKKRSKRKKERKSRKKKKSKEDGNEDVDEGSDSKSKSKSKSRKKSRGKKRKHSGSKDELEPQQKKRKLSDPMAVLEGMTDIMTGESMQKPTISPYGHVMEYDSWCSIIRNTKTRNRCPFTNGHITRRQLVKLDADNIAEYKDQIVNITEDQMGCLES